MSTATQRNPFLSLEMLLIALVIVGGLTYYVVAVRGVSSFNGTAAAGSNLSMGTDIASSTTRAMQMVGQSIQEIGSAPAGNETIISVPNGVIRAYVADTAALQEKGLGDRDSMMHDRGMLFPFPTPGTYAFWMKDMRFDLDMVWIDAAKKVIGVTSHVAASSYPATFLPPSPISYVLELNSGAAADFGLATGTQLSF